MHDPVAAPADARHEYGLELVAWENLPIADAIVAAVPHRELLAREPAAYARKLIPHGCFSDVKSRFDAAQLRAAGVRVWRL